MSKFYFCSCSVTLCRICQSSTLMSCSVTPRRICQSSTLVSCSVTPRRICQSSTFVSCSVTPRRICQSSTFVLFCYTALPKFYLWTRSVTLRRVSFLSFNTWSRVYNIYLPIICTCRLLHHTFIAVCHPIRSAERKINLDILSFKF